jgi:hypothetical protein
MGSAGLLMISTFWPCLLSPLAKKRPTSQPIETHKAVFSVLSERQPMAYGRVAQLLCKELRD